MNMSQSVASITSSSVRSISAVNSTSNQAQASEQGFGQALVSILGGTMPSNGNSALGLLSLAGLLNGTTSTDMPSEEGTETTQLLLDLGANLQQVEDNLSQNESLLATLQSWLQQVQTLLQKLQPTDGQADNGQVDSALTELAKHPETIAFAIRDAVAQLVSFSTKQGQATDKLPGAQAHALLQSLQQMLKNAGSEGEQVKVADHRIVSQLQAEGTKSVQAEAKPSNGLSREGDHTTSHKESEANFSLQNGQIVTAGQLALRHHTNGELKALPEPVPVQNFAKEVSGFLIGKFDIVKLQGISEAKISLYPEHLGQVDVKITMQNGQMVAQFVTEHALAKESLEGQMGQLRSALQAQGIQVTKLEVTQNSSLSSHLYHNDSQGKQGHSGQERSNKRRELQEDELLRVNDLNEEWNEWMNEVKTREGAYGSSFVARA